MMTHLRPTLVLLTAFVILLGIAYPLTLTGIMQIALTASANGSLITKDRVVLGSGLIGQSFSSERYFHARPSATATPYDAAASSGSNLGPLSQKLLDRVKGDSLYLKEKANATPIPADAVTTSASGLDPDISLTYAQWQIPFVAKARGIADEKVRELVMIYSEGRWLGIIGEPHINVLKLNIALDSLQP